MSAHQSLFPYVWAACGQPDSSALQNTVSGLGWPCRVSRSIKETLAAMRDHVHENQDRIAIVVCDEQLSDGSWKDLLPGFAHFQCPPSLIVISERLDSSLWAEVLNLGGFDVLLRPLKENEIARVLHMAHRHGDKRRHVVSAAASSLRASTAA